MVEQKYLHIGLKIEELLKQQHKTKRDLGFDIGMSASSAVYLTSRESIDVQTLHKIGKALKYNFFKHFPIEEGEGVQAKAADEKDKLIGELKNKIADLEKLLEAGRRDLQMQKQENGYLKEINELLKKK